MKIVMRMLPLPDQIKELRIKTIEAIQLITYVEERLIEILNDIERNNKL